jgi:hypothetical protein
MRKRREKEQNFLRDLVVQPETQQLSFFVTTLSIVSNLIYEEGKL